MLAALCGLATAIIGGLLAFPHLGYVGVAAAVAVSGWVGAGVLGIILYRRNWLRLDRRRGAAAAAHPARHRDHGRGPEATHSRSADAPGRRATGVGAG